MGTDHSEGTNTLCIQGEQATRVFQQHDALLGHALCHFQPPENVHDFGHRWIIHHAARELGAENAANHIVQTGHRHVSALQRLFERRPEELPSRLLLIQPGQSCLDRAVRPAPVRQYKTLKSPGFFENVVEQIGVFRRVIPVNAIIRGHHHAWLGLLDGDLEGQQIGFAQDTAVQDDIGNVTTRLLVIDSVMLDVADDALRLQPAHHLSAHPARQDRVFALVFEVAAIAWFPRDVDASCQRDVVALVAQFPPDQRPILVRQSGIPTSGECNGGG